MFSLGLVRSSLLPCLVVVLVMLKTIGTVIVTVLILFAALIIVLLFFTVLTLVLITAAALRLMTLLLALISSIAFSLSLSFPSPSSFALLSTALSKEEKADRPVSFVFPTAHRNKMTHLD